MSANTPVPDPREDAFIYCLELVAPLDKAEEAQGFMIVHQKSGWEEEEREGELYLRIYLAEEGEALELRDLALAALPELRCDIRRVADRDWARAWREHFTAVLLSRTFVVLPPWMADDHPYQDRLAIIIEPATAFGTGHHPTTAMCLEGIAELKEAGRLAEGARFLDLGTGSGILGLGMAMLGLSGVGADIDPLAIRNARENKLLNEVGEALELREGGVETATDERFDLVVANILAEPLIELAPEIVRLLSPGGFLILSGLLTSQAEQVAKAYAALGLPEPRRMEEGEWAALVYELPAGNPTA